MTLWSGLRPIACARPWRRRAPHLAVCHGNLPGSLRGCSRSVQQLVERGEGRRREVSTGCRDKASARQVLAHLVKRAEQVKAGIIQPGAGPTGIPAGQRQAKTYNAAQKGAGGAILRQECRSQLERAQAMGLVKCTGCGRTVDSYADVCPHCGATVPQLAGLPGASVIWICYSLFWLFIGASTVALWFVWSSSDGEPGTRLAVSRLSIFGIATAFGLLISGTIIDILPRVLRAVQAVHHAAEGRTAKVPESNADEKSTGQGAESRTSPA